MDENNYYYSDPSNPGNGGPDFDSGRQSGSGYDNPNHGNFGYDAPGYDPSGNRPELRRIEGFLEDDIRAFVGTNADKYIERFYCISRGQKPYNWCSAIFLSAWMMYRKMWKPALALSVVLALLSSLVSIFGFKYQMILSVLELIFYFAVMGREGNVLYWNLVKEELTKEGLADIPQPDYEKREQLAKRGGTSILFLILFFIFNGALNRLLAFIF